MCAAWAGDTASAEAELRRLSAAGAAACATAVNDVGPSGEAALHTALRCGHLEVARLLIEAGADFQVKDREQWPALYSAMVFAPSAPDFVAQCFRVSNLHAEQDVKQRLPKLQAALASVPDFVCEIDFSFSTYGLRIAL